MVIENEVMTIIANAGDSRNDSLEAIECAKLGEFDEARELLKKAEETLQIAHKAHVVILTYSAQKASEVPVTFILVHASNHLSVAEVTFDMAKNFVEIIEGMKKC